MQHGTHRPAPAFTHDQAQQLARTLALKFPAPVEMDRDQLLVVARVAAWKALQNWTADGGASPRYFVQLKVLSALMVERRKQTQQSTTAGAKAGRGEAIPEWQQLPVSLDALAAKAGAADHLPISTDPTAERAPAFCRLLLEPLLAQLTAAERAILRGHYWDGLTVKETAERLGMQPKAARRAHQGAIRKLRVMIASQRRRDASRARMSAT